MSENIVLGIKIQADGKDATAELGKVNAALGKTEAAGKRTAGGLSAMETGLKGIGSAASLAKGMLVGLAGALTVGEYIKAADAFTNFSSRMKLVTGTAGEYRQAMADSVTAAQRYGMALDDVGKLYARLAPITQQLGRSQSDLNTVMTGIGASLKVSGATAAEASSTITQLTQALASGNVQWEDFGQLLDTNPALVRAVEQELRPLVAQYGSLKEAISKGKVSNDELFNALIRSSAAFREQADTMNGTVGNAWTRLKNSLELATGKIDGVIGASKALGGILDWLSKSVDTAAEAFRRFFNATAAEKLQDQIAKLDAKLTDMANRPRWLINEKEYDEKSALLQKLKDQLADMNRATLGAEQTAKPAFDGVKKSIEATGEAAKEATKHITKLQEAQNRGASLIAVGSKYIGMGEGNQSGVLTKFLNEYSGTTAKSIAGEVNAWCARFVSAVLGEAKIGGLSTMSAKAYAGYGQAVWKQGMSAASLSEVMPGDIAIFTRKGGGGHVGFVKATDPGKGLLDILGGNQSNQVSIVQRSLKDLIAIRRVTGDSLKDFESAEQAIEKEKSAYEKAMAAKKKAADDAFASLKLHQDDAIKRAEDYANIQVAKIKTSMATLKAEEEAQQRVTAAEIAAAKTVDEKQALIASAAQQSAAFHASEQSLVMAEIAQQQKLLEAKRAALTNELKGAQAGQYAQDENQQLAIKQAIRAVDTDLAQLAETRRQAEISAGAAVNEYAQQSLDLKAKEAGFIDDTIAAYQREVEILNRLTAAKQAGATADQLGMLRQYYEQGAQLPDVVSTEQLARVKQYQLSTLAVKEAVDALTKSTEDQSGAEENVREAMLRMNAIWEQTIERIQQAASAWSELTNGKSTGIDKMLVDLARFGKSIDQISAKYKELSQQGKTMDDLGNTQFSETMKATALAVADTAIGMRSMFQIGEEGYKAMTALAGVALVAQDLLNISDGVSAVLKQLKEGDPYTASLRAAIVAAQVMSLGVHIAGTMAGMGSGKSAADQVKDRQAAAGTGTVLGDTKAQSQSITNSLEIIKQNSTNDLGYSAAMLRAMEDLSASILALANNVAVNVLPSIDAAINASGMKFGKTMLDPFSGFNKQLTDEGIGWFEQSLSSILKGSFSTKLYADVTKSFEIMGQAISSSTKTYIRDADNSVNAQITRIFRDIVTTLQEGAKAFGVGAGSVITALKGFKVGMEQISLKDMTMEEQTKALNAVFSKITDQIAATLNKKLKLGLAPFEKAGEGMAETFMRVSEGINRSKGELEQLGMTAINYKEIVNKQGDVAAEIVRQTLEAQGHLSAGVRQYVDELTGSAEDVISAYKKLVDASNLMKTAGFGDQNLNRTMINAAGGLDAFTSAMQSFNDNFLTEAQRFAGASQQLGEQFAALGVAMPASKDGFYQLLMGIDKTTESGQKLFGALLKLNPEFAKLADKIQGIKDKYADILNPFGKFGAQIKGVGDDFNTLLSDLAGRNTSKLEAFKNQSGLSDALAAQTSHQAALDQHKKDLADAEAKLAKTTNKKQIAALREEISNHQTWIALMTGALQSDTLTIARINKSIADYQSQLEKASAGEKSGILADAATVMTKTLSDIFTEIQQTVDAARQKMEAAVTFQKALATQIASLEGPDATAALMRSRAADATRAVDDYWSRMSAGAKRNTDEELRLLGEAQQAIMDKYNAELAAVQQLQQAVDSFNSAITSLRSQIATLQGPGAVASLASRNYGAAFQNIADYRAGIAAGGTRDYAKEVTLIQAAQTAVMDKYNAEMALIQADVQVQAQALQDGLQAQIDAINTATQAQIDGINAATEARVNAINAEVDAQQKAAQTAHDAQLKTLQEQLQAAQRLTEAYKQIAEYAKSMKLGSLTNLSPEAKLAEAQRQYQDTLAKARAGDADAAGKLSGASDAYLEAARAYYGSGTQYSNIFDGVQAAMQSVGGLDGGNPDSIQAHIDAMNEAFQTSQDALKQAAQDQIKAVQDGAKAQTEAVQQAAKDQIKALQDNVGQQIKDLNDPDKNLAMKALKDAAIADLEALQKTAEQAKDGAEMAAGEAAKAAKQYQADTLIALKAIADKAEDTRIEAAKQYADAKLDAMDAQKRAAEEARKQLESLDATAGWSSQQKAALEAIARHLDPTFTMPGQVVPSHARGGYAQAGLALVGEKGAELVRFERPAQVLTAEQTREALNGESPKTFAALEDIKKEMKASVTVLSTAFPLLIAELQELRDEVAQMKRDQKLARNA